MNVFCYCIFIIVIDVSFWLHVETFWWLSALAVDDLPIFSCLMQVIPGSLSSSLQRFLRSDAEALYTSFFSVFAVCECMSVFGISHFCYSFSLQLWCFNEHSCVSIYLFTDFLSSCIFCILLIGRLVLKHKLVVMHNFSKLCYWQACAHKVMLIYKLTSMP